MKKLLILALLFGIGVCEGAQTNLDVKVERVSKKKYSQGEVVGTGQGRHTFYPNTGTASLTLRITLHNTSTSALNDLVVRWGIVKQQYDGRSKTADVAYGREEKCSLKPQETRIIETETVGATREETQLSQRVFGEKLHGHGVQVLLGGRVLWEEFVPGTVKPAFDNMRPLEAQQQQARTAAHLSTR